jgi:hypothetical protein
LAIEKQVASSNLEVPVPVRESAEEETNNFAVVENRGGSGRRSDETLCEKVLSQRFCDIDWSCKSSCTYEKRCWEQPGFLPFAVDLRKSFWGSVGGNPPTTSERQARAEKLMKGFQITTPQGESTFKFSFAHKSDTGRIVDIPICEHSFFVALGGGKTKMWYKIQNLLLGGNQGGDNGLSKMERETARAALKQGAVRAYIRNFLSGCDRPPSKCMTNMYIYRSHLWSNFTIRSTISSE